VPHSPGATKQDTFFPLILKFLVREVGADGIEIAQVAKPAVTDGKSLAAGEDNNSDDFFVIAETLTPEEIEELKSEEEEP